MTKPLISPTWISRLQDFNQLIVGFSGGLDSTVLLHVLSSHHVLRTKLLAVHINHGISKNANNWQSHCQQLCLNLSVDFVAQSVEFDRSANIEEGARIARYAVFSSLLNENNCLILGHHRDDQAETVLLQLFRGTGIDGLAAMNELGIFGSGTLARPFLTSSREQLEEYAKAHKLHWIDDESNDDVNYSRNYLRHQIIPLLSEKWPGVVENIARTAVHCQQAKANLDELALMDSQELSKPSLFIEPLKTLSVERLTNVLRAWLKKNQVQLPSTVTFQRLIHEVVFACVDAVPVVSWSDIHIRRYQDHLYLDREELIDLPSCVAWTNFPSPLILPHIRLTAKKADKGLLIPDKAEIFIKFRVGGEKLTWHGQTRQLKKLFQDWGIAPWLRDKVPLIYINNQLAGVVGFAISDSFYGNNPSQAWLLADECSRRLGI